MSSLQLLNLENLNKTILINNYSNIPICHICISLVSDIGTPFKTVFSDQSQTLNIITGRAKQVTGNRFRIIKLITLSTNIIINNIIYPELNNILITLPITTNGILSTSKSSRVISNNNLKVIVELIITYRYVKSNDEISCSIISGTLNIYNNS